MHLDWDGCFNVRDLGGLPTRDGGRTRRGAIVRADALDGLSPAGRDALRAHGVRTIVDLRNDDERGGAPVEGVTTIHLPLDVTEDREFWDVWEHGPQFGTPLYFGPHLERFPDRNAAVLRAIARAEPGGVAFHCAGGRDRSGQVAMLLLALAQVDADAIAADYALSDERLGPRYAARGEPDPAPALAAFLRDQGTSAAEVLRSCLEALGDVAGALGLAEEDVRALRSRFVEWETAGHGTP